MGVEAYIKTMRWGVVRIFIVSYDAPSGKRELLFYGDPVKAVAALLIFGNCKFKGWVKGKGLMVEAPADVLEALNALAKHPLRWKKAVELGLLQDVTPEKVLHALAVNTLVHAPLRGERHA